MRDYLIFSATIRAVEDIHVGYAGEVLISQRGASFSDLENQTEFDVPDTSEPKKKLLIVGMHDLDRNNPVEQPKTLSRLEKDACDHKDPTFSPVVRDANGTPVLPATAIKGVLRRALPPDLAISLLGSPKSEVGGSSGQLWLEPARLVEVPKAPRDMPYWNESLHTFIRPRNRQDADFGTQLFHVEYVPASAIFILNGRLNRSDTCALKAVFLALKRGLSIGGEVAKSRGQIILEEVRTVDLHSPDSFSTKMDPKPQSKSQTESIKIHLDEEQEEIECDYILDLKAQTLFYSRDPSRNWKDGNVEVSATLSRNDIVPEITGEMVKYALRKISARLELAKGETDKPHTLYLFGSSDQAGRLHMSIREPKAAGRMTVHGIRLCPVSQTTVGSAKFTSEAWDNASVRLGLDLAANKRDQSVNDHLTAMLTHIAKRGLKLGAETAAGFGWFEAEVKKRGQVI